MAGVLDVKAENGTSQNGRTVARGTAGGGESGGVPFSYLNAKCHPAVPWREVRGSGSWEPGGGQLS